MLSNISKAIAAGAGGAAATGLITTAIIPSEVNTPWWGYVIAYAVGVSLPALVTYFAPKNTEPKRNQE